MVDIVDFSSEPTSIDGLVVANMKAVTDQRGTVREFFRDSAFADAGLAVGPWAQVNVTFTAAGAIRGVHAEDMTKLVAVAAGEAFAAYVDLRADSTTFGSMVTVTLTPGVQVLVPAGVGNAFQALVDTQYIYCFDREWEPGMTGTAITPLDPELAIDWPLPIDRDDRSQISAKDLGAPTLAELRKELA